MNYKGPCWLYIVKAPNQEKNNINMVCVTLEGSWIVCNIIIDFRFFVKLHKSGTAKIFRFWTTTDDVSYASKKAPNQAKDLINMVCVTLEGLWNVSDRSIDFRFFVKFHRSGPAIISSFWTTKISQVQSNFTGSVFDLPRSMLVMHKKSS